MRLKLEETEHRAQEERRRRQEISTSVAEELEERTKEIEREAERRANRRVVSLAGGNGTGFSPRQRPSSQSRRLRSSHHRRFAAARATEHSSQMASHSEDEYADTSSWSSGSDQADSRAQLQEKLRREELALRVTASTRGRRGQRRSSRSPSPGSSPRLFRDQHGVCVCVCVCVCVRSCVCVCVRALAACFPLSSQFLMHTEHCSWHREGGARDVKRTNAESPRRRDARAVATLRCGAARAIRRCGLRGTYDALRDSRSKLTLIGEIF